MIPPKSSLHFDKAAVNELNGFMIIVDEFYFRLYFMFSWLSYIKQLIIKSVNGSVDCKIT